MDAQRTVRQRRRRRAPRGRLLRHADSRSSRDGQRLPVSRRRRRVRLDGAEGDVRCEGASRTGRQGSGGPPGGSALRAGVRRRRRVVHACGRLPRAGVVAPRTRLRPARWRGDWGGNVRDDRELAEWPTPSSASRACPAVSVPLGEAIVEPIRFPDGEPDRREPGEHGAEGAVGESTVRRGPGHRRESGRDPRSGHHRHHHRPQHHPAAGRRGGHRDPPRGPAPSEVRVLQPGHQLQRESSEADPQEPARGQRRHGRDLPAATHPRARLPRSRLLQRLRRLRREHAGAADMVDDRE